MSDIVERLREYADDDHERGCAGRCYDCSCGYDGKRDPLLKEAADEIERLRAEAKTRTLEYLGQVGQLSEELERVKREAERAQDAHGVRFLNYLEETAQLTDEIERLRAALREIAEMIPHAMPDYTHQVWKTARTALKEDGDE